MQTERRVQVMNKRILIVDDEPDIRLTLKMLLTSRGYAVDEAEDGQKALERIRSRVYGLMILDLMMPACERLGSAQAGARGFS